MCSARISGTNSHQRRGGFQLHRWWRSKRGSDKATLSCIGRDIEYRELTLERNGGNMCGSWCRTAATQPELLGGRIVILLSELMRDRAEFIGTPTELSAQIDPAGSEGITPKKVSRLNPAKALPH